MLHHISRKRHSQVISQALFAYLQGKRLAVVPVLSLRKPVFAEIYSGKRIPGIENAEKKLVPLFPVLSEKSAQVLHRRSLNRSITVSLEHRAYCIEYIISPRHLGRAEVPCSLRNRRFLCHIQTVLGANIGKLAYIRMKIR